MSKFPIQEVVVNENGECMLFSMRHKPSIALQGEPAFYMERQVTQFIPMSLEDAELCIMDILDRMDEYETTYDAPEKIQEIRAGIAIAARSKRGVGHRLEGTNIVGYIGNNKYDSAIFILTDGENYCPYFAPYWQDYWLKFPFKEGGIEVPADDARTVIEIYGNIRATHSISGNMNEANIKADEGDFVIRGDLVVHGDIAVDSDELIDEVLCARRIIATGNITAETWYARNKEIVFDD